MHWFVLPIALIELTYSKCLRLDLDDVSFELVVVVNLGGDLKESLFLVIEIKEVSREGDIPPLRGYVGHIAHGEGKIRKQGPSLRIFCILISSPGSPRGKLETADQDQTTGSTIYGKYEKTLLPQTVRP